MNAVEAIAYMSSGGGVFVKDTPDGLMYFMEDGVVKTKLSPYDGSVEPDNCIIFMDIFMVREYVEEKEELTTKEVLEIIARRDGTSLYTDNNGCYFTDIYGFWFVPSGGSPLNTTLSVNEIYKMTFHIKGPRCIKQK